MTQLFLNPLTKFTSDNITSLPGARLYFYQNNSSTPKAVYADKNKVTSLGVYVEADSAGIFEPIWLDGTYRAELKYSTNWTSDPVGVVQTGWPIDDIGFIDDIDGDLTVTGNISGLTLTLGNEESAITTKLDWYEEGAFVPSVLGSAVGGTASYTTRVGVYTRIGNVVFFSCAVSFSSHTGAGTMYITGPAFSVVGTHKNICAISYADLTVGAGLQASSEVGSNGAGNSRLFISSDDPASGSRSLLNIEAAATIYISGQFFCA
jgi:hypothetical protein